MPSEQKYTGDKSVKLDLKQFSLLEQGSKDCGDDDNQKEAPLPHSKKFTRNWKMCFFVVVHNF